MFQLLKFFPLGSINHLTFEGLSNYLFEYVAQIILSADAVLIDQHFLEGYMEIHKKKKKLKKKTRS